MIQQKKILSSNVIKANIDQRRAPRYRLKNVLKIQSNIQGSVDALMTDISISGMGVLVDKSFKEGEKISIFAQLGPKQIVLSMQAIVRWSKETEKSHQYGLEFAEADTKFIAELLDSIHVSRIEESIGYRLPENLKVRYMNEWIRKVYAEEEISRLIDFQPPFLKIDKTVIFESYQDGKWMTKKSLSVGKLFEKDVKGHYNNTVFLALCGQLMGQAASILIAALNPGTSPQIIEVENVKPTMIKDQAVWKIRKGGSPFFVDIEITKQRLSLFVVETKISFGDVLIGMTKGMKLFLTPRESILSAKILPPWS